MEKPYGRIEPNQKIYSLLDVLNAKVRLKLYTPDNNLAWDGYVYQLYDNRDYDEYVIDYIRFDSITAQVVCQIKD